MSEQAYPLQWPQGWERTAAYARGRGNTFKQRDWQSGRIGQATFARARDRLTDELRRLGAKHVVISTNHKPDRHGVAIEARRKPDDDGVAVYFLFSDRQMAMACDRYDGAAANMTSLALAIEAMRQLERHGGGTMMERAFAGFAALPAPSAAPAWWEKLGVLRNASIAEIREAHRKLTLEHHPDAGGSTARMAEINAARDAGLKESGL